MSSQDRRLDRLATAVGTGFFVIAVVGCGLRQLFTGEFVRVVPKLPPWFPAPEAWARGLGLVLIAAGVAILLPPARRAGALILAALLAITFLFLHVPNVIARPLAGFVWTNPLKVLTLLGGALLLARWPASAPRIATVLLSAFLLLAGVQHFVYADFVEQLVPAWMPARLFWAHATGVALFAGGLGLLLARTRAWAGRLSGLMIFLWVPLLHIPRAFADLRNVGETSGVFEALAVSGIALLISTGSSSDDAK